MKKPPYRYNIGHRGARSLAPENTMTAFIKAFAVGAHGVETDVSVSSDGNLVLFHDNTLVRTSNVIELFPDRKKQSITTFTWAELQTLDVGSWFVDTDPFGTIRQGMISPQECLEMRGLGIPLLAELLEFVQEKSWFVNIEIKTLPREKHNFPVVEELLALLERMKVDPQLFSISSFHHRYLYEVNALRPDLEINALLGDKVGRAQQWGDFTFDIYNANVRKTDAKQIQKARKHDCRVNLYTVNDLEEMRYFLSLGVEKIITDYPQLLSALAVDEIPQIDWGTS